MDNENDTSGSLSLESDGDIFESVLGRLRTEVIFETQPTDVEYFTSGLKSFGELKELIESRVDEYPTLLIDPKSLDFRSLGLHVVNNTHNMTVIGQGYGVGIFFTKGKIPLIPRLEVSQLDGVNNYELGIVWDIPMSGLGENIQRIRDVVLKVMQKNPEGISLPDNRRIINISDKLEKLQIRGLDYNKYIEDEKKDTPCAFVLSGDKEFISYLGSVFSSVSEEIMKP